MKRAYIAGEALIDLINVGGSQSAHVGGGPANTAKALARLGFESVFVGGISNDAYGNLIESELVGSGVDLSAVNRSALPTALARAVIDENGVARYEFELAGTATFAFTSDWLPTDSVDVVHVGSVATLVEPGASELLEWATSLDSVIVFDPNVRPSIQGDKDSYRSSVEKWISISDVVKLSEDDLSWLYGESEEEVVRRWLESGVSLVVITLGAEGLKSYAGSDALTVPGAVVSLADTVGAGDTIGAVLVEGILQYGLDELMNKEILDTVLKRAVKAAGITCSRAGANPPWKEEL